MRNSSKRNLILSAIVLAAIFIGGTIPVLLNKSGAVAVNIDSANSVFAIAGSYGDTIFIHFDDIDDISLAGSFDFGTMIEGTEYNNVKSGIYENDEFGRYQLHVYHKKSPYIVVTYGDGETVVFNQSTEKATKNIYDQLTG